MNKSTNIGQCLKCGDLYCKRCSEAETWQDFCSIICEQSFVPQPDFEDCDIERDMELEND